MLVLAVAVGTVACLGFCVMAWMFAAYRDSIERVLEDDRDAVADIVREAFANMKASNPIEAQQALALREIDPNAAPPPSPDPEPQYITLEGGRRMEVTWDASGRRILRSSDGEIFDVMAGM